MSLHYKNFHALNVIRLIKIIGNTLKLLFVFYRAHDFNINKIISANFIFRSFLQLMQNFCVCLNM